MRALVTDPSPVWPILEALKDDTELYVRRSVANNLNDIAKDHPGLVVERCKAWKKNSNASRDALIKHGLRTLIKAGDPGALAILGFTPPRKLRAKLNVMPARIPIGGEVRLEANLKSSAASAQLIVIDYVVHYVRQGAKTSDKVFKWTTLKLPARGRATITKRHAMKRTTVRALYPGVHRVELQANGHRIAETSFALG